jgi:[ribosomal protein S5]-alanine N-acetyltransferase
MLLQGSGFLLRPWRAGDEADLVRFGDDRAIWRNMTSRFPHPYTLDDARAWLAIANTHPEDGCNLAIELAGQAIGGIGFRRKADLHTRTAEIGYWLGQPFWGRGLAAAALRLATDHAFAGFDFVRLQASVMSWNPRSCRVAEKAGYVLEARLKQHVFKDGEFCDLLLHVLLRSMRG